MGNRLYRPLIRVSSWIALPGALWMVFFLLIPIAISGAYSFATRGTYGGIVPGFSLDNYLRALDPLYLRIVWNSVSLSFLTALSCFVLGYPLAYWMATASARLRPWILLAVVIPFWTNFVVRAYAIKLLLRLFPEAWELSGGPVAVWFGMVTNYLPFMVLPLYVALERFDFSLLEAARDLGAGTRRLIFRVLLPLTSAGIVTGTIFVFTPALGEFVIPDFLGGARTMLIGNLITDQFLKVRDWPFGSALSALLMITVLGSLLLYLGQKGSLDRKQGSDSKRPSTPRPVAVVGIFALLLLHAPLAVLILQSFLAPDGSPGLLWYRKVLSNPQILGALTNSAVAGVATALISGVLGTSAAFALARGNFPGRRILQAVTTLPLIMPEIVLGLSTLIWFVQLGLELSLATVILAHVTFSVSYVILTVQSRIVELDASIEEAAADLGADRFAVFRRITFPLVRPSILSGAFMAFTLSFDDFLITFFNSGAGSETLPLKIYAMVKFGVSREINAISVLLLVLTSSVALSTVGIRHLRKVRVGPLHQ